MTEKITLEKFLDMGVERELAAQYVNMQDWLYEGAEVGLVVDHHTDEDLDTNLEKFIVEEIEWASDFVRFKGTDGMANFSEIYPLTVLSFEKQ